MNIAEFPELRRRGTCRACDGTQLTRFLPLGQQPLANRFLRGPQEFAAERKYPLDVYVCHDCWLVQLLDVIDPEVLFRDYIYVTGTSETIAAHNRAYAARVVELLELRSDDLVIEVASNDGSLLKCFREHGVRTLGIEPATNIAKRARDEGIDTLNEFFCEQTAGQVATARGRGRTVIGNNVLAHVDDTQDFLRGAKRLIDDEGLVIFEVPYVGEFLERLEYDTVYHEHLCYFSLLALLKLCERVGLRAVRADHVAVHGGSLRLYAGHVERHPQHAASVLAEAETERQRGFCDLATYERFAAAVAENRRKLRELLATLKSEGRSLAAYGAPAKGNTLLNYCELGTDVLPYTVDKSPLKVGLLTPGMHLPVLPVETLRERRPDYTLILAWNFAEEIVRQQEAYRRGGGRFIVPIPEPRIVE